MHWPPFLLAVTLMVTGCAGTKDQKDEQPKPAPKEKSKSTAAPKNGKAPPSSAPVIEPVTAFSGSVVLVNAALKYVVVAGVIGRLPPTEQALNVYRDGQKVGVVIVSNQTRGANFAADISQGEVRVGDTVRSD